MADPRTTNDNDNRDAAGRPVTDRDPAVGDPVADSDTKGAKVYDRPERTNRSSWPTILIILVLLVLLLVWIF